MDREILFRGKTKDGRWMYGDLVRRLVETTWQDILGEYQFAIAGKGAREKTVDFKNKRAEVISCTTVDPATVGQFTGFCDKNGVKIFEGDVVQLCSATYPCTVYWDGIGWAWKMNGKRRDIDLTREKMAVIGNIHDNPELVKEEDEK